MDKKITKGQQYEAILSQKGVSLSDCRVLGFRFPDFPLHAQSFHLRVMCRVKYFLFDCFDDNAYIVIPKDSTDDDLLKEIAKELRGQPTMVELR